MHSSIFLEAKNEEKLKQKFSFFFHQVKIKFAHFGGLQNSNYIFHVKFYSWRLFFEVNGRFMHKKKSFLGSLRFWETENIAARTNNSRSFCNWTHKNFPDQQHIQ